MCNIRIKTFAYLIIKEALNLLKQIKQIGFFILNGKNIMRKPGSIKLSIFIILILSIIQTHTFNTLAALKGACAQVNITPPAGVWLSGYGSRDRPSDDISDDLYAKVLVLNDGQTSIAVISTDLL